MERVEIKDSAGAVVTRLTIQHADVMLTVQPASNPRELPPEPPVDEHYPVAGVDWVHEVDGWHPANVVGMRCDWETVCFHIANGL